MKVYTYSEARQNLARLLEEAKGSGEVWIRRKDGTIFKLAVVTTTGSPFDSVRGVETGMTLDEIVSIVREGREGRA